MDSAATTNRVIMAGIPTCSEQNHNNFYSPFRILPHFPPDIYIYRRITIPTRHASDERSLPPPPPPTPPFFVFLYTYIHIGTFILHIYRIDLYILYIHKRRTYIIMIYSYIYIMTYIASSYIGYNNIIIYLSNTTCHVCSI